MKASEVQRAVAAARSIAAALDLTVDDAIVLQNSNKLALRVLHAAFELDSSPVKGMDKRDQGPL